MTVEAYIELEQSAGERHEYLDGSVYAMSGGTFAHDALSTAAAAELRDLLRGGPCVAAGPNLRVKSLASGLYTYADALVTCSPRFEDERRTTLLNPRVVIEVLSEATEAYDRGDKFAHYRAIDSVDDYVLVSTTSRRVEVFTRSTSAWELREYRGDADLVLPSVSVRISLTKLYAGVELDPARGTTPGA